MQYNSCVNRQWVMLYSQYEDDHNDDVLNLSLFQASSHCLNHRRPVYTAAGFTKAVELVSPDLRLHIGPLKPPENRRLHS